jgi:signal transduction histidine kinase
VADVILAAALCLIAVASAATGNPDEGAVAVTVPAAVGLTVPVAWRGRAPLLSVLVIALAGEAQSLLADPPGSLWALAVYLLAAYSVGAKAPEGRAAVGGTIVVGALWLQEWHSHGRDYLFVAIVFGGAWLVGRAVRHWTSRADVAERNQDERATAAVAAERARIARELHDVVAHGLGVIAIQADAAEAALEHNADLAAAPLRAIKNSSREALDEMRRLLMLLRMSDIDAATEPFDSLEPQPGLGQLDTLVASVRGAGLPVTTRITGTPFRLPPGVDLSAYRMVQEALTNVLKHAGPARTCVLVTYAGDGVHLEVRNEAAAAGAPARPGTGNGLLGMRERASVMGGTLHAGPDGEDGFLVHIFLPTHDGAPRVDGPLPTTGRT